MRGPKSEKLLSTLFVTSLHYSFYKGGGSLIAFGPKGLADDS